MSRRTRSITAVAIAAAVCLGLAGAWLLRDSDLVRGHRARATYPHIVLVTFDTLNVWYTSLFSDDPEATPNLQALADSGVLFDQARTVVPITLPSHTSLLSGRMPWDTGVMVNGDHVPDSVETLPEILHAHGYRTAAFLSLGVLNPSFNLDQGFDEYDPVPIDTLGRWYRTADEVTGAALNWMGRHADESYFVWIHLADSHEPYVGKQEPPDTELLLDDQRIGAYTLARDERHVVELTVPPGRHRLQWRSLRNSTGEPVTVLEVTGSFELRSLSKGELPRDPFEIQLKPSWGVDLENPGPDGTPVTVRFGGRADNAPSAWARPRYQAQVTYADRFFGTVRKWLGDHGLADDTLWLVASDHGEGLGHGGTYGHAAFNHEEQMRTLLLLSGPGIPAGRRLASPPVLLVDAFPTVLELLGLPKPEKIAGKSLVDCWSAGGCRPPRREWLGYGVGKRTDLRSSCLYRWPFKALWSRRSVSAIFDLSRDPREADPVESLPRRFRNLRSASSGLPSEQASMVEALSRQIEAFRALVSESGGHELDEEQKEMLRSLGYL